MVRNSGKFGKPRRGGGKKFTPARVLSGKDTPLEPDSMWASRGEGDEEDDSEEEDSDEEEESGSEEEESGSEEDENDIAAGPSKSKSAAATKEKGKGVSFGGTSTVTIESKEARAKAEESSDEEDEAPKGKSKGDANQNRDAGKARKIASLSSEAPRELTRKEREARDKKAAAERYRKLHEAGKTEEAQKDLARLAKIRAERAAAAEKSQAEKEEKVKRQQAAIESSARRKK